jgi:hypothetical protein
MTAARACGNGAIDPVWRAATVLDAQQKQREMQAGMDPGI